MKFKVGDLVQLSAAGKARQGNLCCHGGFGFVIEIQGGSYPIRTQWWKPDMSMSSHPFKEYELKKFKKKLDTSHSP